MRSIQLKTLVYFFIVSVVLLLSCETESSQFEIGGDLVESKSKISLVDTFLIQLSTVKYDSLPTSGTANALVGYFENDQTGSIELNSYFTVDLPSGLTAVDSEAVFDSLILTLYYGEYLIGDTTTMQTLQVYRLKEELMLQEDDYSVEYLFNTSRFPAEDLTCGELFFLPQVHKESIEIRLDDKLGRELLQLGKDKADEVLNNTNFNAFFKGLVLKPGENPDSRVLSFSTDSIKLQLHTHVAGQYEHDELVIDFNLSENNNHFNALISDRSGTDFENLISEREKLFSRISGDKSFIQGTAGVLVRVDFPSLNELYKLEDHILLKAELVLRPSPESFASDVPQTLHFYETGKINQMNDQLVDADDNVVYANLALDELYKENSYYIADITTFLSAELAGSYYNIDHGLLVTVPLSDFKSQTDHLILEGEKSSRYKPTLNLYFLTYE